MVHGERAVARERARRSAAARRRLRRELLRPCRRLSLAAQSTQRRRSGCAALASAARSSGVNTRASKRGWRAPAAFRGRRGRSRHCRASSHSVSRAFEPRRDLSRDGERAAQARVLGLAARATRSRDAEALAARRAVAEAGPGLRRAGRRRGRGSRAAPHEPARRRRSAASTSTRPLRLRPPSGKISTHVAAREQLQLNRASARPTSPRDRRRARSARTSSPKSARCSRQVRAKLRRSGVFHGSAREVARGTSTASRAPTRQRRIDHVR